MLIAILKYLGLYGFTPSDFVFSVFVFVVIIVLTKLNTRKK